MVTDLFASLLLIIQGCLHLSPLGKCLSTIGLVLDIVGAVFVAIEVVYQFKGRIVEPEFHPFGKSREQRKTKEFEDYEKTKYSWMWVGLALLTLGFVFQIYGLWN